MNLYNRDYRILSENEKIKLEKIKKQEFRIRLLNLKDYDLPLIRHSTLFPNNHIELDELYIDRIDLHEKINKFEILINNKSTKERDVISFIKENESYFIIGSILENYNFGHHGFFIFPEFSLSNEYKADYLAVGENSDGFHFVFIELESIYGTISLKDGSIGNTLTKGIKQIENWEIWLEKNFNHLKTSFKKSIKETDQLPEEFIELDKTRIHFAVIAGRRNDFSKRTYRTKRNYQAKNIDILHYDNLIDSSKFKTGL